MSIRPFTCEKCQRECSYLGVQVVSQEDEKTSYGVVWGCTACDYKALDVCPLGPLVPAADLCLSCGAPYPAGSEPACTDCGLTQSAAVSFLQLGPAPADPSGVARSLFGKGLFRRGLAVLNQALQQHPAQETPWLLKCSFVEGLGLHDLAVRMLEGALERGGPASLLVNYSAALHRAGRHQDAGAAACRYLELEPQGRRAGAALTNLGLARRSAGDDEGAEEAYRRAVAIAPDDVLHYLNLAQLLLDQRRWAGALGVLEAGLDRAKQTEDRVRFLEGLAYLYAEEERAEQALAHAEQALTLGAAGPRAHYLRGRALALLGRLEEARAEMLRVLEIDPNCPDAPQALAMIDQALAEK